MTALQMVTWSLFQSWAWKKFEFQFVLSHFPSPGPLFPRGGGGGGGELPNERGRDARRKFWIIKTLKETNLGVFDP